MGGGGSAEKQLPHVLSFPEDGVGGLRSQLALGTPRLWRALRLADPAARPARACVLAERNPAVPGEADGRS